MSKPAPTSAKPRKPVFSAKLNATYRKLANSKGKYKRVFNNRDEWWGGSDIKFIDDKGRNFQAYCDIGENLNCCGLSELSIGEMESVWGRVPRKDFPEILAKALKAAAPGDSRVFIVGLPVKVSDRSMYNPKFYKHCVKVLESFGMKKVNSRPYKNKNSQNDLIVMVGQF